MARSRKTAARSRARRVAKRTARTAGNRTVHYAKAAADGVQKAARTVAHKVSGVASDVAAAARRNPRKAALAAGAAAVVVAATVRARKRRKRW